jgi:hypothetical protein
MAGFGLKILRSTGPDGFVGNQSEFPIAANNTAAIFRGDLVRLNGGVLVEASGAANNDDFSPLGVFLGCRYVAADGSFEFKPFWDGGAGRSNIVGMVAIPDGATFLIKGSSLGAYTQANIGSRFGINYAAGSTIYGDSRVRLGAAAANSTGPLRLLRLVDAPFNAFGRPEPLFEVNFARSQGYATLA